MSKKQRKGASRLQQQAQAQAKRTSAASARGSSSPPASPAPPTPKPSISRHEPSSRAATEENAPPAQAIYLDVAAVRIQEWLARTPALKFRRGASVLLSETTAADFWASRLPDGVTWNPEAGEVSGVVSLRVAAAPEADIATVAKPAAVEVVRELRKRLPQCALQAVAARSGSYSDAYRDLSRARRAGDLLVDSPAPPDEALLAKPCDMCRSAAAINAEVAVVDDRLDLCTECTSRRDAGGLTKGSWQERSPLTERRLLTTLKREHPTVVGFSDDFYQLATAGKHSSDGAATQLALIFADGNKVGDFLTKVSGWVDRHGSPNKSEIARAIDDATRRALANAVTETFLVGPRKSGTSDGTDRLGERDDPIRPPVLVHLADGDDLLVSVPAGDGWRFTRALLAAFDDALADTARGWKLRDIDLPSLSAGLVFHHNSHPFSDVLARATERLESAKRDLNGERAAVAFLDLTADGDRPTPGRPTRTLEELEDAAGLLGRLAAVPQSQRSALAALCRQSDQAETAERRDHGETAAAALARRAVDLKSEAVWAVVAGSGATTDTVRELLLRDAPARVRLRHHLDLARWWPPTKPTDIESSVATDAAAQTRGRR